MTLVSLVEVQGVVRSEKEEAKQKNHKKVLDSAGTVRDGNQFGNRWSGIGSRSARSRKAHAVNRGRCIWRKQSPIAGDVDGRGIFLTPNAW
jgi:hypothetical protein